MKISTRCVHLDVSEDQFGAIAPPIYQTATFRQPGATEFGEYDYTRTANPTRTLLEQHLGQLEGGMYACAFASGMAAITALVRLVSNGEEIIAGDDLYGGTIRLLDQILPRQGIKVHYADTTDAAAMYRLLNPRTKLILVETPSNPMLQISDIRHLAQVARDAGALLAVDNSMLSPLLQRPLALGADVVIHSATKFLGGHSDVTAGALITNDKSVHERIAFQQNAEGAGLSPFESWLLMRGLKTLAVRVNKQTQSAQDVVKFLESVPAIRLIYYPGLKRHPGSEIHRNQSEGNGSVISFTTGDEELSKRIVEATKLFDIAVSFGSVASTISLPCRMSHASIPLSLRDCLSPPADLVRLSVGIEDVNDLIADLEQAFAVAGISVTKLTLSPDEQPLDRDLIEYH